MKTNKCPTCGKEWPVNYCLNCALLVGPDDTIRTPPGEDDIINDTYATCPAKIRLNPFRYSRFAPQTRPSFKIWQILAIAIVFTAFMKWWSLLGILLALFLPLSFLFWWISRQMAAFYKNALLTPGMVVSLKPLEFISIANMDAGTGVIAYAVKRVAISTLPSHPNKIGAQFPCVSYFTGDLAFRRWDDFFPQPLSFATGNMKALQARSEKIGENEFNILKLAYELGKFPKQANQLVWIPQARPCLTAAPCRNRSRFASQLESQPFRCDPVERELSRRAAA